MPIYRDIYDGPPRHYGAQRTDKRYLAIHCTENTASAQAENSYAKRRADSDTVGSDVGAVSRRLGMENGQ